MSETERNRFRTSQEEQHPHSWSICTGREHRDSSLILHKLLQQGLQSEHGRLVAASESPLGILARYSIRSYPQEAVRKEAEFILNASQTEIESASRQTGQGHRSGMVESQGSLAYECMKDRG